MSDLFETASRNHYRFASVNGFIATEDLWRLPLKSSTNSIDLDGVARLCAQALKTDGEESFVDKKTEASVELLNKLEIVKHIIQFRLDQAEVTAKRQAQQAERNRLVEILHQKRDASLQDLSEDALLERIKILETT